MFGVFVAIGMICAKLLAMSERTPTVLIGVGLLFVAFEVLLAGFTEIARDATGGPPPPPACGLELTSSRRS